MTTHHADDATIVYIAQLEQENAALKDEVSALKPEVRKQHLQLLAAQHRIKQLRHALESYDPKTGEADLSLVYSALALPDSTAELEAVMKKAEQHTELLMAVENKWQNETRHETALRYIRRYEEQCQPVAGSEMKEQPK